MSSRYLLKITSGQVHVSLSVFKKRIDRSEKSRPRQAVPEVFSFMIKKLQLPPASLRDGKMSGPFKRIYLYPTWDRITGRSSIDSFSSMELIKGHGDESIDLSISINDLFFFFHLILRFRAYTAIMKLNILPAISFLNISLSEYKRLWPFNWNDCSSYGVKFFG
jgi:hypothetical protein